MNGKNTHDEGRPKGARVTDQGRLFLTTAVVRSAHQGESHGAVYVVDLDNETFERVIDWSEDIQWVGRGSDRGLRGIAFYGESILIAASKTILVFDRSFRLKDRIENPYLAHCHEIAVLGHSLWVTSTGHDALLCYDLERRRFSKGYHISYGRLRDALKRKLPVGVPRIRSFDPDGGDGPSKGDTTHLNNVFAMGDDVFFSGAGMPCLMRLGPSGLVKFATIPFGTHNTRPHREGVLMNDTKHDAISFSDRKGCSMKRWNVTRHDETLLINAHLPRDHARQGFCRGLCMTHQGEIVVGSSPATVSMFCHGSRMPVKSLNLSMDVRLAIHGLEELPRWDQGAHHGGTPEEGDREGVDDV